METIKTFEAFSKANDPDNYYESMSLKHDQLEQEISQSSATPEEKSNMQHTLSKLWMFTNDLLDDIDRKLSK